MELCGDFMCIVIKCELFFINEGQLVSIFDFKIVIENVFYNEFVIFFEEFEF